MGLATYLFEGRILTFLRPEAIFDRFIYIIVANFIIGTIVALYLLRYFLKSKFSTPKQTGFRSFRYTVSTVLLGGFLGFIFYFVQSPPTLNPTVLSNAFAQVLTVTIAESIICWAIIGTTFESLTSHKGKYVSAFVAIIVASFLFGIYHFAHSPPFNTVDTVFYS